jgi:hypothetical protein
MMGAVLAAGSLLLYPLEAAAQTTAFSCEFGLNFSYVTIKNTNMRKKRATCQWDCVYQMPSGRYHINRGTHVLRQGEQLGMNKTKKLAQGINRRGGGYAACN